ncbi:MAG: RNA polymerase sigma factor [Actinomycetota bacterium]
MAKPRNLPAGLDAAATDEVLVAGCLAGDERAWAALILRYAGYIHAVASRAFGLGPSAADEVFQDVCVRLYDGLAGYAGRSEFRPWLRAVSVSACREYLRREARQAERAGSPPDQEPAAELDELEIALDVRAAVDALGDPCRMTIGLYFFRGLTQAQVAKRLRVPAGTVAARLSRCLKRLRGSLQESGLDPASRE